MTEVDIPQRLEQWKQEATDLKHPNHGHASLDEPVGMYATISGLLNKLRTAPESFGREDVVALFGTMNSGRRMKNRVAKENSLPQLREHLLTLLDGEGAPSAKIDAAAQAIKYAGRRMIGELYGWAHADTAPLYNDCATTALTFLGYEFEANDYDAFVAAHEQFKQIYQQHVDHLRLDLPLNLEIDKLYNVIDKVDSKSGKVLGKPDGEVQVEPDCPFSEQTFEILVDLQKDPTHEFYTAHKDALKDLVIEPFKGLMLAVRDNLPPAILDRMETEKYIFANIIKQFTFQGCWDFYWGAFYTKGGKRTKDAQLFIGIHPNRLEFGFYIGEYGSDQRKRFVHNCQDNYDVLARVLDEYVPQDELLLFGEQPESVPETKNAHQNGPRLSFRDWFRDPAEAGIRAGVSLPKEKVLQQSQAQLAQQIADLFKGIFPLVLLAALDDPMPAIDDYLGLAPTEDTELNMPYPLSQCATDTGFEEDLLARWVRSIERKGQAVVYGPPGTGKTYVAEHLARHLIGGGDGFYELVQFHPAYAYEDFIQGIRPKARVDGQLDYPVVPGRFLDFCDRAKARQDRCVLIIDEINRANLARVFGELMYLLEYRDREVPLAAGGSLRIPKNVRVLGTMNTADRSIALVDHALRRRFAFLSLYPNYEILQMYHQGTGFAIKPLVDVLRKLNRQIGDRNYEVGITFFLREDLEEQIEDIWTMEIEPYLEEYFFDQQDKVDAFRWEQVKKEILAYSDADENHSIS
jgi:5-methylcytosine-specific restriction protein B